MNKTIEGKLILCEDGILIDGAFFEDVFNDFLFKEVVITVVTKQRGEEE